MPSAYQRRTYDNSQHTGRMGDLLRARSETDARALEQAGQNSARMWSDMGGIAANTMGQLASYADQAPERRLREAQAKRIESQTQDEATARATQAHIDKVLKESVDPKTGRLDYPKAAAAIGQVSPEQAEGYWAKADAQTVEATKRDAERAREVAKRLAAVVMASDEDESAGPGVLQTAPRLYASVREEAIASGLIKPDELPEAYDPSVVKQEVLQAMTADQVFQKLWAAKPANAEYTLNPGDQRFSGNRMIAQNTNERPGAQPNAGSLEDYIRVKTQENGGKPLSAAQIRTARAEYTAAGRPPSEPPPTGPTPAQIQRARDNRFDRLAKLSADTLLSADERARQTWEIEREFAVATGAPEPPRPFGPQDVIASEGRTSYEAQPPRNATMGDMTRPPQPSAPLGAPPAAAAPTRPAGKPGPITITLPNGKPKMFKSHADLDAFVKKYGLRVQ